MSPWYIFADQVFFRSYVLWHIRLRHFAVNVPIVVVLVVNERFGLHVKDGQTYGRSSDYQNFSHLWVTTFLTHGAPLSGLCARGSSAMMALEWQLSTHARSDNRRQLMRLSVELGRWNVWRMLTAFP